MSIHGAYDQTGWRNHVRDRNGSMIACKARKMGSRAKTMESMEFDINSLMSKSCAKMGSEAECHYADHLSIRDLQPGVTPADQLTGLVIRKDDTNLIKPRTGEQAMRCVFSFTIRDSPFDYVNVSLWGSQDKVRGISSSFSIGDTIQIAGLSVKEKQGGDDRFKPWTPVPYEIFLSDSHSSVSICNSQMLDDFIRLAHMPLHAPGPIYRLSEIVSNIDNLPSETVSFTAAVRLISPTRFITVKSTGKQVSVREVKIFDQHIPLAFLTLWSNELAQLSEYWQANETIVTVMDARVSYDQYKKAVVASTSSKTIIIINPDSREAAALYQYAQSASWPDDDIPEMSAALGTINYFLSLNANMKSDSATYGIVYCFLSSFDVDGPLDSVLGGKCCECGKMLASITSGRCSNYDCVNSDIADLADGNIFYRIKVELSDHTGTAVNCRLSVDAAAHMLQLKPEDFAGMSDDEKSIQKWKFLFERCKVIIKAYRIADMPPTFAILDLTKCGCQEFVHRNS